MYRLNGIFSEQKRLIKALVLILLATAVLPIIIVSLYAYPFLDDFTNALGWLKSDENKVAYIYHNASTIYKNWQGTYFGNILCSIPIYELFGITGVRVVYLMNAVLFFFSCYCAVDTVFFRIHFKRKWIYGLLIIFFGLLYLFGFNNLSETFYWWTGICVYTLPVSFIFLSVSYYIMYREKQKMICLIAGMILAFFGAGGALNVTALLCGVLAYLTLRELFETKKVNKSMLIFVSSFVGALINAAAPGNFVRHTYFDSELKVLDAISNSALRASAVLSQDLSIGFLLVAMIVSFIIAYMLSDEKNDSFRYPGLVSLFGVGIILITEFPVMLGYAMQYVPDRCAFVEKLAIAVVCIYLSSYWGGWCKTRSRLQLNSTAVFIMLLISATQIFPYFSIYNLRELTPYKMIWHLGKGDYKTFTEREDKIIDDIRESEDTNVVLYIKRLPSDEWVNFSGIGLNEDDSNTNIANYYGKDSITIIYEE